MSQGAQPPEPEDPIEQKVRELLERPVLPDDPEESKLLDEEFEERLREIESRAAEAKAKQETCAQEKERQLSSERESAKGLGIGLSIAYTIIGLPVVGYGIGWLIDMRVGSTVNRGFGMLIGACLGIVMTFIMLNRAQK